MELTIVLPNAMLVALTLMAAIGAGFTVSPNVVETAPETAFNVALCVVLTEATVALNPAVLAPAATVTVAGTVTAELLLERLTACLDCAAPVRYTEQPLVVGPVKAVVPQEIRLKVASARRVSGHWHIRINTARPANRR